MPTKNIWCKNVPPDVGHLAICVRLLHPLWDCWKESHLQSLALPTLPRSTVFVQMVAWLATGRAGKVWMILVENWALYHSFMVMNYLFLYLSVICCFVFYLCSILFGIISNFQSCRFSGVICSSCIIYMPTHHSILRFLWNSIHLSNSVQTWSSASYLCPRLCAFDSRHYPIPVYLGNQETRFHANVGVLAMKWNVIDTRGAF